MEIFTTMITPFAKSGEVDLDTARRYVDFYRDSGIDGIFAVCQSSEIFFLTLEERVALNRCVYRHAKEHAHPMTVVSSGHVGDTRDAQARELCAIAESGTDALILITNRLDPDNQGDDIFIENAEWLLSRLPKDIPLGFYECPYPYKRLLTPRILEWALSTRRFRYIKDTSCDIETMRMRSRLLAGSGLRLLNANCQTLLESVKNGADGYCGVMCNFHPELYARLAQIYKKEPQRAAELQALLGSLGFIEGALPYPLTAKYHMTLCGIPTENIARARKGDEMGDYARHAIAEMKRLTDSVAERLSFFEG